METTAESHFLKYKITYILTFVNSMRGKEDPYSRGLAVSVNRGGCLGSR